MRARRGQEGDYQEHITESGEHCGTIRHGLAKVKPPPLERGRRPRGGRGPGHARPGRFAAKTVGISPRDLVVSRGIFDERPTTNRVLERTAAEDSRFERWIFPPAALGPLG